MRRLLAAIAVILVIIVLAALIAPMFIPAEAYKARLEREASAMLGREVTIGAVPKAALFPNPAFTVRDLSVANAPGMSDARFVGVEEADIGVRLFPLFSGNVEIERFVLTRPEIYLERRADGEVNWVLGSGDSAPEQQPEAAGNEDGDETGDGPINDLRLGDVKIVDGAITYRDRASDQTFEAREADISIGLDSLDAPLTAAGDMTFQGRPARLDARIETARSLMTNAASVIDLFFAVEENEVDAEIELAGGALAYNGRLRIDAPSLRSLLATLGMAIDADSGFDRLIVEGDVAGTGERLSFSDAALTFDEISGRGTIDFSWAGPRPAVSGRLDFSQIDLTPYLPAETEAQQANREDKDAAFPDWPATPIDFSPLRAIDVDITATTEGIVLPTMRFGRSDLSLTIDNGVLDAALDEINLYDGGGDASLRVNAARSVPAVSTSLDLKGLNAQNFARDVLGLNRLTGIGGLQADLSTSGRSVADFVSALNGEGTIEIDRGAMEGIDLGKMIGAAGTLISGLSRENGEVSFNPQVLVSAVSQARGPSSETQFTELTTPFTVTNGVVRSENIVVKGPLFLISGNGSVNLPRQSIDMAFVPTVFQGLEDETGRTLNLPLMIGGTFNDPTVGFDTRALLQGVVSGRLRGLLQDNGIDVGDGRSLQDAVRDRARSEIENALGLGRAGAGQAAGDDADRQGAGTDGAGSDAAARDENLLEDELKNRALDAIFGARRKTDRSGESETPETDSGESDSAESDSGETETEETDDPQQDD